MLNESNGRWLAGNTCEEERIVQSHGYHICKCLCLRAMYALAVGNLASLIPGKLKIEKLFYI